MLRLAGGGKAKVSFPDHEEEETGHWVVCWSDRRCPRKVSRDRPTVCPEPETVLQVCLFQACTPALCPEDWYLLLSNSRPNIRFR